MIYPAGSFSGNYEPKGDISEADSLIAFEFAYREGEPGLVNTALAEFIVEHEIDHLPLILSPRIAQALADIKPSVKPEKVLQLPSINYIGTSGGGTWGELMESKDFMERYGLRKPILGAQAFHVGRVAIQSKKAGMNGIVVPQGLPRNFDPESVQPWTRDAMRWRFREAFAVWGLRLKGQI